MIHNSLIKPKSIVVIGASNNITKPGGKLLKNLIDNKFKGRLFAVNRNEEAVQGVTSFKSAEDLPDVELAVIAIPYPQNIAWKWLRFWPIRKIQKGLLLFLLGLANRERRGGNWKKRLLKP